MKISRRTFALSASAAVFAAGLPAARAGTDKRYAPQPKGDSQFGSFTQSWFMDSFLEIADDLEVARTRGKRLALIWELDGCPYCREMHLVNFAIPEITDYVRANFEIVQVDIKGSRQTTDFDGKAMSEKELARRHGVRFTPTIQFFPETLAEIGAKAGRDAEVARMPGYFRPFHFLVMFEYVREKGYEKGDFRSFLHARTEALKAAGKGIPTW